MLADSVSAKSAFADGDESSAGVLEHAPTKPMVETNTPTPTLVRMGAVYVSRRARTIAQTGYGAPHASHSAS